ncbi:RidA family protein [Deinococcus sp. QL22]|uniref:RidA family protein n=1 Tax=Deinococcus sp. QL22 TaxID=2939437 RepID=UPI002017CFA2|nr:RidA family protein [Deinococcus sp. QL22]UQN05230.1 RidA family protein [Deinococcus sp. QL22]
MKAVQPQRISGGSPWEDVVGYSRAVRVGQIIHVAGTTATLHGEVQCVGDAAGQTRVILNIIQAALERLGGRMEHVVRTRIYVTDIGQWEAVGRAHGEVFADIRPAASMVQVAALIDPEHLVEIEAEAILPLPSLESGETELDSSR